MIYPRHDHREDPLRLHRPGVLKSHVPVLCRYYVSERTWWRRPSVICEEIRAMIQHELLPRQGIVILEPKASAAGRGFRQIAAVRSLHRAARRAEGPVDRGALVSRLGGFRGAAVASALRTRSPPADPAHRRSLGQSAAHGCTEDREPLRERAAADFRCGRSGRCARLDRGRMTPPHRAIDAAIVRQAEADGRHAACLSPGRPTSPTDSALPARRDPLSAAARCAGSARWRSRLAGSRRWTTRPGPAR